ncbi:MAG: shikimate kinase [Elusimicrobia bacterium]|nr:shikimate kinase [Elusimicrobiota bacterium]
MKPRKGREAARIYLIGFMASGKSVVGRALARRLGVPARDVDAGVEAGAGESVARIFARRGEAAFRDLESRALAAASAGPAVVSVGGGAVTRPANVRFMRRRGVVVHLEVPLDALYRRARKDGLAKRPLLAAGDRSLAAMRRLLAERAPFYRKARHLAVDGRGPVEAVARRVERRLRELGRLAA